jgi:hypothetical protein
MLYNRAVLNEANGIIETGAVTTMRCVRIRASAITSAEFAALQENAAPCQATSRVAAVYGPSRPGPLHKPPREK